MNAYASHYLSNHIRTASPEQILVMLYDGAIKFCQRAIDARETDDKLARGEGISRALAIISELNNTLDHEVGGEIAAELDGLYGFMSRELVAANVKNDDKKIVQVVFLLKELRETWVIAIDMNRKAQSKDASLRDDDEVVDDERPAMFRAAL